MSAAQFILLNGWRVPVTARTRPQQSFSFVGEHGRRWDNRPSRGRRSVERSWQIETKFMERQCAETLAGILEGRGHHFPFVHDVWSEGGLGPDLGSAWTLNNDDGPAATRQHSVTAGVGGLVYNPRFIDNHTATGDGRWCVLYWYKNGTTWEHRAVRSDDSKLLNGVRKDGLSTTELVVAVGGVAFLDTETVADVVLLPFWPCDEYLIAVYYWLSGLDMVARFPFNSELTESLIGTAPSTAVAGTFVKGQVDGAFDFDGVTGTLSYPPAERFSAFGKTSFSVQLWLYVDGLTGGAQRICGTDTGADGWSLFLAEAGGVVTLGARVERATTDAITTTTTPVPLDTWVHVVASYSDAGVSIYLDNVLLANASAPNVPDGAINDDTGNDFTIGSDGVTDFLDGRIDDLTIHDRSLSTINRQRFIDCGLLNYPVPGPRMFSPLPSLEMWGDIEGCRKPILVSATMDRQHSVQHGGSEGWVNNDVETSGTIGERRSGRPDRVVTPYMSWLMTSRNLDNPHSVTSRLAAATGCRSLSASSFDLAQRGLPGPFGHHDAAFDFDGTNHFGTLGGDDVPRSLYGSKGATVLAWVLHDAAAAKTVIDLEAGGGVSRLRLEVDNVGVVQLCASSDTGSGLQSMVASTSLPLDEWRMIGGTASLAGQELRMYLDGLPDGVASGLAFGQSAFSDEGGIGSAIGDNIGGTLKWQGKLCIVYVWLRVLTPAEVLRVYESGRKGVFL